MLWISFGIFSALLLGVYDVCRKAALQNNAVLPVLWLSTVASACPFVVLIAMGQVLQVEAVLHVLILIKAIIVASSWVLEFFALKNLEISVVAPVRASQPVFTLLGAVTLFGERLTAGRWAGILIALVSYAFFSIAGRKRGERFRVNKWIVCAFGAAIIGAGSSLYDKLLLNRIGIDPLVVQSWYTIYIAVILGVILLLFWLPRRAATTKFSWRWSIPCIGLLLAAADALYFFALREPDALIAMLAMIRRANVVISFAAGAFLFREQNIRPKAVALGGILAGVILMTIL